ncbi:MAG: methyltransferase, partial [Myxococcota bacterium]
MPTTIDTVDRPFIRGLVRLGGRAALVSGKQTWTGDEILDYTGRAVTALRERGLDAGQTLLWDAADRPEALALRLAAMQLGARFAAAGSPDSDGRALTITDGDLASIAECRASEPEPAGRASFTVVRRSFAWPAETFLSSLARLRDALGVSSVRTAVLSPLAGFGGDAALASWSAGVPVHHQQATAPGQALAFLEKTAPDSAVLSATLLRGLFEHPAFALADLDALERIIYGAGGDTGGALSAAESQRLEKALGIAILGQVASEAGLVSPAEAAHRAGQRATRAVERATDHPAVAAATAIDLDHGRWAIFASPAPYAPDEAVSGPQTRQLAADTNAALDAEFAADPSRPAIAAVQKLGQTALLSMLNALYRCGLFTSPAAAHSADEVHAIARVAAPHRLLIHRWLRVLTEQGLLRRQGQQLRAAAPTDTYSDAALARAWDEAEAMWTAAMDTAGTIDYARRNADLLPELIRGEVQAVHLLFPAGRPDLARALYREHIAARYQHRAVAAIVGGIARQWSGPRPLRVLEVGAGTGATSEVLLPELGGLHVDYVYTDVSRYFLDQAEPELARYPMVRSGLYDIDRAPWEQGVAANSFDVIIGGGVLNAARNTDASVCWLRELLVPGGWLVLTEPTVEEFWVMASQAFMLADASDGRAETEATFLSLAQWNAALDSAGLQRVLGLPDAGHPLEPLGHRV